MKKVISIFLFLALGCPSLAQNITVGEGVIEDYLRRQQLLGKLDSSYSFSFRPLTLTKNGLQTESTVFDKEDYFRNSFEIFKGLGNFTILPARVHLQYDSHHPDSRNDGGMIRSKGLQTLVSAGFYAEFGPLSVQFQPELIKAQNKAFPGFPETHFENVWASRYIWWNRMDEPERYGEDPYSKITSGQSSIRLNKWGLSLGLSSENLWWGPAIRNSIMMSNNAQGFPHITFNTQRPQKTFIGDFEWQFITGKLEASGFDPPNTDFLARQVQLFVPKKNDDRYLQAFSFTYSPKWVKGLSLGATRWIQQYFQAVKDTKDFLPIISNVFRKNDNNILINEFERDQAASLSARWLWYDSKAEVYFEFAKNDAAFNLRDLLVDTDHSRAITFGMNKLFDLP
ncbi:MAG TPA: capsule assembly Wzi family protein, partial [Roseivirga sp.]